MIVCVHIFSMRSIFDDTQLPSKPTEPKTAEKKTSCLTCSPDDGVETKRAPFNPNVFLPKPSEKLEAALSAEDSALNEKLADEVEIGDLEMEPASAKKRKFEANARESICADVEDKKAGVEVPNLFRRLDGYWHICGAPGEDNNVVLDNSSLHMCTAVQIADWRVTEENLDATMQKYSRHHPYYKPVYNYLKVLRSSYADESSLSLFDGDDVCPRNIDAMLIEYKDDRDHLPFLTQKKDEFVKIAKEQETSDEYWVDMETKRQEKLFEKLESGGNFFMDEDDEYKLPSSQIGDADKENKDPNEKGDDYELSRVKRRESLKLIMVDVRALKFKAMQINFWTENQIDVSNRILRQINAVLNM